MKYAQIATDSVVSIDQRSLTNSATIAGRRLVQITSDNLHNLGGRIQGDAVQLQARADLNNIGGSISAANTLIAHARRDLNLTMVAGKTYTQVGSDVLTPGTGDPFGSGDITISAQDINITEARESSASQTQTKLSQSGLTLSLTNPVISALQSVQSLSQAASQTQSGRMAGLAAASAALTGYNAVRNYSAPYHHDQHPL